MAPSALSIAQQAAGALYQADAAGIAPPPPGQETPQQEYDEAALAQLLMVLLIVAISVAAVMAALRLRFRLSRDDEAGLTAAVGIVMDDPPGPQGIVGPASRNTSRLNLLRRAQFAVSAGRRLASDIRDARAHGRPVTQALADGLARERRYYGQHKTAMWQRSKASGAVDMAWLEHGDLLGWLAVMDSRTSAECRAASGRNFRASVMPSIGYPGAVHPHCRCMPVAPWPGGKMLR